MPARPAQAPERPVLGGEQFATVLDPGERPRVVTVSTVLWLLAVVAAGVAVAALWLEQDAIRARFAAMVVEQAPTRSPQVVTDAARYAFLATAGSVALVAAVHTALALLLRTGRTWARNLLVLTGVLGIAVAIVVQDLVTDPARGLLHDVGRIVLLVQATLIVPAVVTMLLPAATAWFRRVRVLR
ncbi:hypothetical protein CAE01nite_21520 [Cellulomonas aerilata]|uniref:Uncharacterized protein n=1 Tax=Cellulomonas aerilata TaxID=515326 RepID=A0A512DDB7_9CELL|nr:hypothetical protein CAE01nite_21520 [Cellulomonas aerilata]